MSSRPTTGAQVPRRRRGLWITLAAVMTAAIIAALALAGAGITAAIQAADARPPGIGTAIVAPAQSKASAAADTAEPGSDEHEAARYLAAQPTAYWLTPESDPTDAVWDRIASLAAQARDQDAALAVVVYGLPGRDCGNHSSGGLDDDGYADWTTRIGEAMRNASDLQRIVILEPDSLALAPECDNIGVRTRQLADAVDRLTDAGMWLYLDGGHSQWLAADEMATLIRDVDRLDVVRGFATNVSNYQSTADEIRYAHDISALLQGAHAVIDTSRNGAGSDGQWCNPPGRLVGDPGGTHGDDVVDTNLWIKPPGESDGPCNGGPDAGLWWPAGAVALTRDAR